MESKFIEGTNQQYSIFQDGSIYSHKNNMFMATRTNKPGGNPIVDIKANGKTKRVRPNLLLAQYFGIKMCLTCFETKSLDGFRGNNNHCRKCINKKEIQRKKLSGYEKIATKRKSQNIPKHYTAKILGVKSSEVSDEVHKAHKDNLLFKRQVASQHSIHIQKLQ